MRSTEPGYRAYQLKRERERRAEKRRTDPEWVAKRRKQQRGYNKAWYLRNPEARRQSMKEKKLRNNYHMTWREYQARLASQKGLCAICGRDLFSGLRFCIDHDHITGGTRGILCVKCNTMLGMAADDEETLQKAIAYLRDFRNGYNSALAPTVVGS